jgi:hypothetical protein
VPDDYLTGYRITGLYALTRAPFAAGVRKLEAQRSAVFATDAPAPSGATRVRFALPPSPVPLQDIDLRRRLSASQADALQVPSPSPADMAALFTAFAPRFEIDIASNDDKPGTLAWGTTIAPELDTSRPALYHHAAYTRYQGRNLLQLVYTLWFPARPAQAGSSLDLLAGKLDGIVWRVTLAPNGTPLVYDSIHPCGCYHMFFPTPAAQPLPAPESGIEWAFIPQSLPAITAQDRLLIRIASQTHYIDRVTVEPTVSSAPFTPLALQDYDQLRALPVLNSSTGLTSRNVFSPTGFIDGSDRAERWLFWPMGIARAGTMRQWGRQATAFVGRRHFDDATLMQQRFRFDMQDWD